MNIAAAPLLEEQLSGDIAALDDFAHELARAGAELPQRINADPDHVEQGLAKLVLTLVELVRQLLEKQAIRRIESGSLEDDEIERMGKTFLKLEKKMGELTAAFGLASDDLNLNLGPLGNLM